MVVLDQGTEDNLVLVCVDAVLAIQLTLTTAPNLFGSLAFFRENIIVTILIYHCRFPLTR